jgi:N-acylneuraminate cytidylyltransferase
MSSECVVVLFARGGSKGIPGKNVKLLNGKPLIAYSIEVAKKSKLIDRVFISTDDDEIATVAKKYGAEVTFMRPAELATDTAPEILAWKHAINILRDQGNSIKTFVTLPATSPFRSVQDVDNCILDFQKGNVDLVITGTDSERSPYFNMVKKDEQGYVTRVIEPETPIHRRQDAPPVFDMTTVAYVANPDFILKTDNILSGKTRLVTIPKNRALDIDTEFDFKLAEFFIKEGSLTHL